MADALTCVVVTPEETALEESAEFVAVPMFDGELGVLAGRTPLIGRLGYGELRIRQSNGTVERFYLEGGFVQIQDNVVSLLTSGLTPLGKLSVSEIEQRLTAAQALPGNTPELLEARLREISAARAQLRMAQSRDGR